MILTIAFALYASVFFIVFEESIIPPTFNELLYGVIVEALVVLLFFSSFVKTPNNNFFEKSGWFAMFSWSAINLLIFTWLRTTIVLNIAVGFAELFIFASMFIYSQVRSYDVNIDEYNKTDSFIVFKKPQDLLDYFFCCIKKPVSSVCVISKGVKYGYKMGKNFNKCDFVKKDKHIFIKINKSNEEIKELMECKIGNEWSFERNCCESIHCLFPQYKFRRYFDRLPCFFMQTILTIRKNNK